MANILVIDASPLIYANFSKVGHFSVQNGPRTGEPTGLRYGFLRSVRSYAEKTKADRVVICYDRPGQVLKATGQASYKADRVFTDDKAKMFEQIPALKEMLGFTRYAQAEAEGFEADDIIGHFARMFAAAQHDVFIVSTDNDLLQLVSPRIRIWMPPKKSEKAWLKDEKYCQQNYGVKPNVLLHYRALVGDPSDNIKGCGSGAVFERRMQDICNGVVEPTCSPEEFIERHLVGAAPDLHQQYQSNYHLMRLWEPGDALKITKGSKDPTRLGQLLEELEMKSMLKPALLEDMTGRKLGENTTA